MCLIVHRDKKGGHIPDEVIEHNLVVNGDGFGIGWREKGKLHHARYGPGEARVFANHLKEIDRKTDFEYMAHFRYGTHGPDTVEMAHPFVYSDPSAGDVLVFHNGIINIIGSLDKSDTCHFVEQVLKELPPRWWENLAMQFLVERAIGYSRLSVMTGEISLRLTGDVPWISQDGLRYSTQPYMSYGKSAIATSGWGGGWGENNYKGWYPAKPVSKEDEDEDSDDYEFLNNVGIAPKGEALDSLGLYRPGVSTVRAGGGKNWKQVGHDIEPVDHPKLDEAGEAYGDAWCRQCDTIGEYYIFERKAFINVPHLFGE